MGLLEVPAGDRSAARAAERAREMVAEGADSVEISLPRGSRRPGVDLDSLIPIVSAVRRRVTVPIAVETADAAEAGAAARAGAEIIRSRGVANVELRRAAVEGGAALILRPDLRGAPHHDVVDAARRSLLEQAETCLRDGVPADRLLIDPGCGPSARDDLTLLRNLDLLTRLPYPVVLAADRKEESLAVITWAVMKGVRVVRVRDVRASKRACLMVEAVLHPDLLPVER